MFSWFRKIKHEDQQPQRWIKTIKSCRTWQIDSLIVLTSWMQNCRIISTCRLMMSLWQVTLSRRRHIRTVTALSVISHSSSCCKGNPSRTWSPPEFHESCSGWSGSAERWEEQLLPVPPLRQCSATERRTRSPTELELKVQQQQQTRWLFNILLKRFTQLWLQPDVWESLFAVRLALLQHRFSADGPEPQKNCSLRQQAAEHDNMNQPGTNLDDSVIHTQTSFASCLILKSHQTGESPQLFFSVIWNTHVLQDLKTGHHAPQGSFRPSCQRETWTNCSTIAWKTDVN